MNANHYQPLLTCRIVKQGHVLLSRMIVIFHWFINICIWFGTNIKGNEIGQIVRMLVLFI